MGSAPVPRFIPTLTEVVSSHVADAAPAVPSTERVQHVSSPRLQKEAEPAARPPAHVPPAALEDEIVHRVLQRIDILLAERLGAAVAAVAAAQTRAMLPRLREEIDHAVRACVAEALALELSDNGGGATPS